MRALVSKLLNRWSERKGGSRRSIEADPVGVSVREIGEAEGPRFPWADVIEIRTYKADLGMVDEIRLAFRVGATWVECIEDDEGFGDLARWVGEVFPEVPDGWYSEVMHPAFAPNERTLYRRA